MPCSFRCLAGITAGSVVGRGSSYDLHGLIECQTLHLDEVIDRISRDVLVRPYPKALLYDEAGKICRGQIGTDDLS